jgi:hypothetical protein
MVVIGDLTFKSAFSKCGGRSFAKEEELCVFAREALTLLSARCPRAIIDGGLNRVDIMCLSDGKWVVNEFESLEACYEPSQWRKSLMPAQQALEDYWFRKLCRIILEEF